jgi:hypothetical protein
MSYVLLILIWWFNHESYDGLNMEETEKATTAWVY